MNDSWDLQLQAQQHEQAAHQSQQQAQGFSR